ncbi:MAG TPA: STAS domain-containing protein [Acidimicrobiales bacterium]|nr:STAS domain-containing protein [Acidimicrobiales bacterium]
MSATVEDRQTGAEHAITLREIDRSNVRLLAGELHRILDRSDATDAVRLDCRAIEFIDSHGIAALIRFSARVRSIGKRLVLTDATPPVRRALEALGLGDRLGLG